MKNIYMHEYLIPYFMVDGDLMLKPSNLTVYLQDLAIEHANSLGFTLEWLWNEKRGWAITNWHIKVKRYPLCGEKIKILTWSTDCKKIFAQRSFQVVCESGEEICTVASRWVYMDLINRKPSVITQEMADKYYSGESAAIENEKYTMPKEPEGTLCGERGFTVTRTDTDSNGHANNTKYIEWALDDVPDDVYNNYKTEDIKVVYRKECYKGSNINSKCYVKEDKDKRMIISFFTDANNEKTIYAAVATVWTPKDLSQCKFL